MAIKKQEFYEGAALHLLARAGAIQSLRYEPPFFFFNERLAVLLKYSTKPRSPWGFTFTPDEQELLQTTAADGDVVIGMVCGGDGVAAIRYADFVGVAARRSTSLHIACYRLHREHYEINGPDGCLGSRIK